MSSLTCCLIRRVVSSKPAIRHRGICDKNNSHGVARGLHLCSCRYRATESLQPRGVGQHAIDNLKKNKIQVQINKKIMPLEFHFLYQTEIMS